MANDIIELRTGHFSSVFMTLNSSSLTAIKRGLAKKVQKSPGFFQNLAVILQFSATLEKINLTLLKQLFDEHHIHIIGVCDWQNALQKELILTANLPLLGKTDQLEDILPEPRYLPSKIIEHDIEPQQVIYAKHSDLIIHGDVKAGAEVAAEGNIHIYGKLQGRAMAGVNANNGMLFVHRLDAEFIAVNQRFLYKEKIPTEFLQTAVRIFSDKDKLVFKPLYP
ncbi:septum site-determining protein MinC [Pasteurellaceae bacterium LIM206]|nr:septum site-determining protein MinC [Pasteurellaceae bacterium LIM206]